MGLQQAPRGLMLNVGQNQLHTLPLQGIPHGRKRLSCCGVQALHAPALPTTTLVCCASEPLSMTP